MDPERWSRIERTFQDVLAVGSTEREERLDSLCGDDTILRSEVAAMLRSMADVDDFLERPPRDPWIGTRIGAYEIVEVAGHGGMSTVYVAERADDQYRGRVAIKLMSPFAADRATAERFRRERQILVDLEHPNIAHLHDSGTVDGLPFVVMELVDGEPIDRWCDERRLPIETRLELVLEVCDAVDHAHQNLIVHRDLKPANILINDRGQPKLLDFGIAKVLRPGDHATAPTRPGDRWLTPRFASPEQLLGRPVHTATDVYSLGLLLHLLLTGELPYTLAGTSMSDVDDALAQPRRLPSQIAAQLGTTASRARRSTPEALRRRLKGDLDVIVSTALRPDPKDRYRSVAHLAQDLRRHLEGHPIHAMPPTWSYRFSRFLRREKLAVAAISLLAGLAVALGGFAWTLDRHRAEIAAEQAHAEAVSDFLIDVFDQANPGVESRPDTTVRDLLAGARQRIDERSDLSPEVRIRLLEAVTDASQRLGLFTEAMATGAAAHAASQRLRGPDHPRTLDLTTQLAALYEMTGDFATARRLATIAVDGLSRHRDSEGLLVVALVRLASIHSRGGELDAADMHLRRAIDLQSHGADAPNDPLFASSLHELALVLFKRRQLIDAERFGRQAFDIWTRAFGPEHPDTLASGKHLAYVFLEQNRLDEAEALGQQILARERQLYGGDHPAIAFTLHRLSRVHRLRGEPAKAAALAREALELRLRVLHEEHPAVAVSRYKLAELLALNDEPQHVEALFTRSLDVLRVKMPSSVLLAHPLLGLGRIQLARRDVESAAPLIDEAIRRRRAILPADDPLLLDAELVLAEQHWLAGRRENARALATAVQAKIETLPDSHPKQRLARRVSTVQRALGHAEIDR
ncbi:MAG: serine/threonine-protein kinase [Acidobacteriota bacterium]